MLLLSINSGYADTRNLGILPKQGGEQKRHALVIGNAAYQGVPTLKNPVNDAKSMAEVLNKVGFKVIEVTNAGQKEMNRAITAFGNSITDNDTALFFYAGHGLQVKGENFIVPVDAQIDNENSVGPETVSMNNVMSQLDRANVSIVILDACRNNPYERGSRKIGGGGLAQMDAPKGSFIAYSTAPGKTASDGNGKNGLFTQELLKQIGQPGLTLEQVLKRVRSNVSEISHDEQMPWDSSSLTGEVYFVEPSETGNPPTTDPSLASEREAWALALSGNTLGALKEYINQYPSGQHIKQARIIIAKLSTSNDSNPRSDSINDKYVAIPGRHIAISKYLVTKSEFATYLREIGKTIPQNCLVADDDEENAQGTASWGSPGFDQSDSDPVVCVNYADASNFASWLSKRDKLTYRLPTSSEWESACLNDHKTKYCGGDDLDPLGWYLNNSGNQTHPVAQKKPSMIGLFDMTGNVSQMVSSGKDTNLVRGGDWGSTEIYAHASFEGKSNPDIRKNSKGFRLVYDLK